MFNNVKHLELGIPQGVTHELDRPVSLLSAFPSITVLKLKVNNYLISPTYTLFIYSHASHWIALTVALIV